MTFRELLEKYKFEDIVPEILQLWDNGNLYLFRHAYDLLRVLESVPNGETGVIEVHRVNDGDGEAYNRVCNLSNYGWSENLDWELDIDADCNLTERQLLALCLWERTYYGFSPWQQDDTFRRWGEGLPESTPPDNSYFKRWVECERRHYRKKVKRCRRSYDSWGMPLWPEESLWDDLRGHRNRRDRKAEQRYERRSDYLERMSRRSELIKEVCQNYSTLAPDNLKFILCDRPLEYHSFIGLADNAAEAVEYIAESIVKYSDLPPADSSTKCIALLRVPAGKADAGMDTEKLTEVISLKAGCRSIDMHIREAGDERPFTLTVLYFRAQSSE